MDGLPLVTIVTDRASVAEDELFARLDRMPRDLLVQLRDKYAPWVERYAFGRRLIAAIGVASVVVNGDVELALELGAHRLHLPAARMAGLREARAALGPEAWISVSCHDANELERAVALAADAALLSPIFSTPGKDAPLGLGALADAREMLQVLGSACRLVALGGVDASNASACLRAGAHGVAAIRADLGPWLASQPPSAGARR